MHRRGAIGGADVVKFVGAGAIAVIALVLACQLRCGPATRGAAASSSDSQRTSHAATQKAQSPGSGAEANDTMRRRPQRRG